MTVFGPKREKSFMFYFVCAFSNFLVKERQSDRSEEDSVPPWDGAPIDRKTLTTRRANMFSEFFKRIWSSGENLFP